MVCLFNLEFFFGTQSVMERERIFRLEFDRIISKQNTIMKMANTGSARGTRIVPTPYKIGRALADVRRSQNFNMAVQSILQKKKVTRLTKII
jgi:predicted metalloprotease